MPDTNKIRRENLDTETRGQLDKIPGVNGNQTVSTTSNVEFASVKLGAATMKYNSTTKCIEFIIP